MEEFAVHLAWATEPNEGGKHGIRINNFFCKLKYCRCMTVKNSTYEVSVCLGVFKRLSRQEDAQQNYTTLHLCRAGTRQSSSISEYFIFLGFYLSSLHALLSSIFLLCIKHNFKYSCAMRKECHSHQIRVCTIREIAADCLLPFFSDLSEVLLHLWGKTDGKRTVTKPKVKVVVVWFFLIFFNFF